MVPNNTEVEPWCVVCNNPALNAQTLRCANNSVSTTKYSLVNFLPRTLFQQFLRAGNLYYLLVSGLSFTPLSPVGPGSQVGPFLLVVIISLLKEWVEDRRRAGADLLLNSRQVDVLRTESRDWARTNWRSVVVGNLVRVRNGEVFPADLLLLASSDVDGVCYVSTTGLDGGTNLKLRRPCSWTNDARLLNSAEVAARLQVEVQCDPPNPSLCTFSGMLLLNTPGVPGSVAISTEQLLLRGCRLMNTACVVGIVIFAGWQTKVMMNIPRYRTMKRSSLDGRLDHFVLLLLALVLVLSACLGMSFGYYDDSEAFYLNGKDAAGLHNRWILGLLSVFVYLALLSPIIPVSLYTVVELVRFLQCKFLMANTTRKQRRREKSPIAVHEVNLCEDLGRIGYILSDKTGTLTCNSMKLVKCSIAGTMYGSDSAELEMTGRRNSQAAKVMDAGRQRINMEFSFNDSRLMCGAWRNEPDPWVCLDFFRCLAICHTVSPEASKDLRSVTYKASSPDEVALVAAAKNFGFILHHRDSAGIRVLEQHVEQVGHEQDAQYSILNVLEFDSTRKRQSVICRHPDGKVVLYCKGADSVIFARMDMARNKHSGATLDHLERFGAEGLRTLCLAYRELGVHEYNSWNAVYLQAKASGKVDQVADLIEKDLFLLGCTAVEDKLQNGVTTCIRSLSAAGIKLWMLTGDKTETAINIAFACGLLTNSIKRLVVNEEETGISKDAGLDKVVKRLLREALLEAQSSPKDPIALVIDGECLAFALEEGSEVLFLALAVKCKVVICSRVSPLQKAVVTGLVRDRAGKLTLSIGDGANDVAMIQAAHIGIGINGQEGPQAVMASDFSISQFSFLSDLLLVHGRRSYFQMSEVLAFLLYKNLAFALTQFWFILHCLFSGVLLYDEWYMSLYSILFTISPVFVVGVLDMDVSPNTSKKHPELYRAGVYNAFFTWKCFARWAISAFCHSLVLFYLPVAAGISAQTRAGLMFSVWDISTLILTCVVITVNLRLLMVCGHNTTWHYISVVASILVWLGFAELFGAVKCWYDTRNVMGVVSTIFPTRYFWLCLLLVPTTALTVDFLVEMVHRSFHPLDYQLLQEHVMCRKKKKKKGKSKKNRKYSTYANSQTRKSTIEQRRKTGIEVARRTTETELGVEVDVATNMPADFPGQTALAQTASSATVDMRLASSDMALGRTHGFQVDTESAQASRFPQPNYDIVAEAPSQASRFPQPNYDIVAEAPSRASRFPQPNYDIVAEAPSPASRFPQPNYDIVAEAPSGRQGEIETVQSSNRVGTRALNQVWSGAPSNQDWAGHTPENELWEKSNSYVIEGRAAEALDSSSQRDQNFQPHVFSYTPGRLSSTVQSNNSIPPSLEGDIYHAAEIDPQTAYRGKRPEATGQEVTAWVPSGSLSNNNAVMGNTVEFDNTQGGLWQRDRRSVPSFPRSDNNEVVGTALELYNPQGGLCQRDRGSNPGIQLRYSLPLMKWQQLDTSHEQGLLYGNMPNQRTSWRASQMLPELPSADSQAANADNQLTKFSPTYVPSSNQDPVCMNGALSNAQEHKPSNPGGSLKGLSPEDEKKRKSMAIVISNIRRELQTNNNISNIVAHVRTRASLNIGNPNGGSFLAQANHLRNKSTDINKKQVTTGEFAFAHRKLREKLRACICTFIETKSGKAIRQPAFQTPNNQGNASALSRRAQSNLVKVLGGVSRRHTGFAFEVPESTRSNV